LGSHLSHLRLSKGDGEDWIEPRKREFN